jgi:hypothetical protein
MGSFSTVDTTFTFSLVSSWEPIYSAVFIVTNAEIFRDTVRIEGLLKPDPTRYAQVV